MPWLVTRCITNNIIKYTDDTTVVGLIGNNKDQEYREEVEQLVNCCSGNLLLNVDKTKENTVDFRMKQPIQTPLMINSAEEVVDSTKFLGLYIMYNLIWSKTQLLWSISTSQLCFLCRIRKSKFSLSTFFLDSDKIFTMIIVYSSVCLSVLSCFSIVLSACLQYKENKAYLPCTIYRQNDAFMPQKLWTYFCKKKLCCKSHDHLMTTESNVLNRQISAGCRMCGETMFRASVSLVSAACLPGKNCKKCLIFISIYISTFDCTIRDPSNNYS